MRRYISIFILLLLLNLLTVLGVAEEYISARGIIHVHSEVSGGVYSVKDLANLAREHGLKVIILTDHALIRGEYGLSPLPRVIRKSVEKSSVLKYGAQNYIDLVNEVDKSNPDLILVHGVEAAPFYYWAGGYFKGNLTMHNWHKQILVMGLKDARHYENLPLLSNRYSSPRYHGRSIYRLWPLISLILGILLVRRRQFSYVDSRGRELGPRSRPGQVLGVVAIVFSMLFLWNNFPFSSPKYDQYHGDEGVAPYQNLIDYVNRKGAVTFWTSPEASTDRKIGRIKMSTLGYPQDLLQTYNYTGFAALYQDNITFTDPGEGWDQILNDYCQGRRKQPVWGIGELDFHGLMEGVKNIDTIQTVFILSRLDREAVLEALRRGRMYAVSKSNFQLVLEQFVVEADGQVAIQGEEIGCSKEPEINIKLSSSDSKTREVKIRVVRKGKIIRTFKGQLPLEVQFKDDYYNPGEKIYYRLDIRTPGSIIISNPIFVKFRKR